MKPGSKHKTESHESRAKNPNTTMSLLCAICCNVDISDAASARVVLSACRHESCKSCLVRWIATEESTGTCEATCPFCRLSLTEHDVVAAMGRSFRPAAASSDRRDEATTDDLTRGWLMENTRACGRCGAHIEKAGGCNRMQCLCGWRFCYKCGRMNCWCREVPLVVNAALYGCIFGALLRLGSAVAGPNAAAMFVGVPLTLWVICERLILFGE